MAEEEKNEQQEEQPQEEGSEDSSAGPVAEEDSSSSPEAAGEDPTPAPPAEEEAEPAAEEAAEEAEPAAEEAEAPAAETEAPAADEGDELPWKERRRLERSRQPHEVGPQQTPDERAAARAERRRSKAAARSRYRQAKRAKRGEPGSGTPAAERRPNPAKVRLGVVVSDKADKTITVRIDIARRHPTYEKIVRRSHTLHAHDERNEAGEGDTVRLIETRPLSRMKRWRLLEVIEKAK
jgi:small subunit ribosomal protein S17